MTLRRERQWRTPMVAALAVDKISVLTYRIDERGKKPRITFSDALIERCRRRVR